MSRDRWAPGIAALGSDAAPERHDVGESGQRAAHLRSTIGTLKQSYAAGNNQDGDRYLWNALQHL